MRLRAYCFLPLAFISLLPFPLAAQKIGLNRFAAWKPRNIGPSGMSGRITAIDALADDPNQIYLGAASGGVWKTTNGGGTWTSVFDDQPILNIGSVAMQQNNPSVVWVGTGEGNPRNSINLGEGIFKTLDGGRSWKRMGLEKTRNIHRILIDPLQPNTVYAGVIGNPYAEHPERGVFKTTDGGETWARVLFTNDTSGVADMVMDPSNPNKLFAAMWQHRRTPWSLSSGGPGSGLYMTLDGGRNWKKLGKAEGLPDGPLGRIGLAISRSRPERVYALIEASKNGLYKSDDGGYHWELVNSDPQWVTNRPFYFQEIACDPENENRLWLIYQMISVSEDAGKTFKVVIPYNGIHPDHHAFWIHPRNGNFIIDGNDGGIGITRDRGKTWLFDEKLPVGQFYHVNTDNERPYHVMGGMQDNGSWRGPAYTWMDGGIKNYYWESVWGGDGFDVMPDPDDANWIYAMSQRGFLGKYHVGTGEQWFIRPVAPPGHQALRFNWNAAIAQDPFDRATIYFGSQFLHKSTNKGASWEIISPDLSTSDSAKMDQRNNGGLSLDITGAENHCTILTIAPSALDKNLVWVGTDDGNLQLTRDGGKTWTNFRGRIPGMPTGCWIPQIQASRHQAGEAFVVCNDYRRGDFRPYIFRTRDYGKTWTRLVDDTKVKGYALCMIQDPASPNLIFVGTEQGLWVSLDNGVSFEQWKNGYPSVSTYDLAIQEREADLVIATFGRALWVLDDIRPLRQLAASGAMLPKKLTVFPTGDIVQAQYRNAPGYEWSTWGIWDAANRPRGAGISYFIEPEKGNRADSTIDSVAVTIYNEAGEPVRNLKWKPRMGFNRSYWSLDEKGYRAPGSPKTAPGAAEPRGLPALPGRYKLVMTYQKEKDSVYLDLKDDPRLGSRSEIRLAQRQMKSRLRTSADQLNASLDQLTDADDYSKKIETQLKGVEGTGADTLRKACKALQDSIKAIRTFIRGESGTRQGYGEPPQETILGDLQIADQLITAKPLAPGRQELLQVEKAEKQVMEAVSRTDRFLNTSYQSFRRQVTAASNLFVK